jgi:signal transduction histidine kinase
LRSKIAGFVELFRKTRALARANEALHREIAEREVIQEALRELNQALETRVHERTAALEDAVRARDDFLSIASHELRNPINAIQLQLVGVLRAAQRDEESLTREWIADRIGRATAQVGRITRLLDNLLDVSRLTTGRLDLEPETVDLGSVVHTVVELFRAELDGRQVTVRATEAIGHWDRLRLEQIVMNLLSNAIKYGNGKPIEISLDVDGDRARLSVTDYGIGIDEESQKRLFGRFERAVSGLHYGGFGLGLWITRQIVETMEGQISVESRPGEGSTFSVILPLASSPTAERNGGEQLVT